MTTVKENKEKVMNQQLLNDFINASKQIINELKEMENKSNDFEYDLIHYEEIPEGTNEEVTVKYEIRLKELNQQILNRKEEIENKEEIFKEIKKWIESINYILVNDGIESCLDKEKNQVNQLISTFNYVVHKLKQQKDHEIVHITQTNIGSRNELQSPSILLSNSESKQELLQEDVNTYELQHGYYTVCNKFSTNSLRITWMNSLNKLKEWSGKQDYMIVFDSDIDGNGLNGVLQHKIFNKSNLYFIQFDNSQNIYGGFVSTVINHTNIYLTDSNAFTFSLVRNGIVKNMKYSIKKNKQQEAFTINCRSDWLYAFGHANYSKNDTYYVDGDIFVSPIPHQNSSCYLSTYCYNGEEEPLVNNTPDEFETKRILVLQMS